MVFECWTFEVVDILPTEKGVFYKWFDAFGYELWVVNDIDKTATVINTHRLEVIATVSIWDDLVSSNAKPDDVMLDPFRLFAYWTFTDVDSDFDMIVQFNRLSKEIESGRGG